jgi:DNA repair photolyase
MSDLKRSIENRVDFLNEKSSYDSLFDWNNFFKFHNTYKMNLSTENGFQFINGFAGCENCHVGFQIDTYLEGCTHDCKYCYAKFEGEQKNQWNNPVPVPLDFTHLWLALYETFEKKERTGKLYDFFIRKVPLRIGSLSDPFLSIEKKLNVSQEVIKLLNHYNYPYLIVTRSDMVSSDLFLDLLNKDLASVHISIPSLDPVRTKALEPGAPSPEKRLATIKKLRNRDIWVTARVNPLFPVVKDGEFQKFLNDDVLKTDQFNFYSDELIEKIAETNCKSILVGFVTLKSNLVNELSDVMNFPLRNLMKKQDSDADFKFSTQEIRSFFSHIRNKAKEHDMDFTTCYLGQSSSQYFSNQDMWDNLKDCCNSVGKVSGHKNTSLSLPRHQVLSLNSKNTNIFQRILLRMLSFILGSLEDRK